MLRCRIHAGFVLALCAIYLVASIGCATGGLAPSVVQTASHRAMLDREIEQAGRQATLRRLPSIEQSAPITLTSAEEPLWQNVAVGERSYFEGDGIDLDDVVRGQEGYYGPLKEFAFNPYVVGAIIVAAIVVPIAVNPRDGPVGVLGDGGPMVPPPVVPGG